MGRTAPRPLQQLRCGIPNVTGVHCALIVISIGVIGMLHSLVDSPVPQPLLAACDSPDEARRFLKSCSSRSVFAAIGEFTSHPLLPQSFKDLFSVELRGHKAAVS